MSRDPVRAIADAVLYEGYILWPYRRSALKNQRRFTFGGVFPPAHTAAHPDDRSSVQTEVLIRGARDTTVEVTVRFLQVVTRAVFGQDGEQTDELVVDGQRYLAWEEAVEQEVVAPALSVEQLRAGRRVPIAVAADLHEEQLDEFAGCLVRSWEELRGVLQLRSEPLGGELWRIRAEISNTTSFAGGSRRDALKRTFCSTHTLLNTTEGAFLSATDPRPEVAAAAAGCRNVGTWPVLVGERGERTTILSSPIILEDYPRVAPESPGDLFDGGEIDQLLVLNILALTDQEKAEMAASDPRAREILERTEALTPEQLLQLHGTIREFGVAR